MGITIHFEGQLRDARSFDDLIRTAIEYARGMNWGAETFDLEKATLLRVKDEQEWDYVGPTRGVTIWPHENCDPIRLEFDKDLYIQEYTKTQFAGPEVHIWVAGLLRRIEPYFKQFEVLDEGEYWESGNRERLEEHMHRCDRAIDQELKKNPSAAHKVKMPDGRIIDLME